MTGESSTACPICHQNATSEIYRCHICVDEWQYQRYVEGDGTCGQASEPFWYCSVCGFVFRVGQLGERILASYTEKPLAESQILASINAHYEDRVTSKKIKRLDWIESHCKFEQVLDVGTGSGDLVKVLCDRGYKATGIDPDRERIRLANQHFGLAMDTDFYTDVSYPASEFDLIICECVLYRFSYPDVFLLAAWKHLRPTGHVFLVLPDVRLVQLNFLTNSVRGLYSEEGIEPLLASRGFRLVALLGHAEAPGVVHPGNFAVLAQKIEPASLEWSFSGRPTRETVYDSLLKQDYGLLRRRSVWPGALALLKALDDQGLYRLGKWFSRGTTLMCRALGRDE